MTYKSKTNIHSFDYMFDASSEKRKNNNLSIHAVEDWAADEDKELEESKFDFWMRRQQEIAF